MPQYPTLASALLSTIGLMGACGAANGVEPGTTAGRPDAWRLNSLETEARDGRPDAEVELGDLYEEGRIDALPDPLNAARWYLDAAEQGDPRAWRPLGELYLNGGGGIDRDFVKARHWLLRAAGRNDARAQYDLGRIFAEGLGVAPDWPEARYWFERALHNGNRDAARYLGVPLPPNPSTRK